MSNKIFDICLCIKDKWDESQFIVLMEMNKICWYLLGILTQHWDHNFVDTLL